MTGDTGFDIYLITDRHQLPPGVSLASAVESALKAGVRAVQLREKDLPTRPLLALAYDLKRLTAYYGALFFINDRADIALCVGADGVHLGHASMPVEAVRRITKEGMMIGVSTHSPEEALAAEREGADFITFGPVFMTPSKIRYGKPVGLQALRDVCAAAKISVFAIGGIRPPEAAEVCRAGASGVAVISGILAAPDIALAIESYDEEIRAGRQTGGVQQVGVGSSGSAR